MARLPILMYHNVSKMDGLGQGLTISESKLEDQFRYLKEKGFTCFHLSELEKLKNIPSKSVVITFDDVTLNQLELAVPLLNKYKLKATFFIPFQYIGQADLWNEGKEAIMDAEMLQSLDASIELGLHSYAHQKYSTLSDDEIKSDFEGCYGSIRVNNLNVYPALAYPYGNFPKKEPRKSQFQKLLQDQNIKMGLRIGNRVNRFPFKNPYEINRIDIKGEDSLLKFKLKLRLGKLRLF
ncbi:polysaccharide deacetylase family protein [Flavobacterium faecale]|uniref:polysaccharide deacetylase family protein n=1 Tax=Flavobacterium faecale TaxID=1355330 RepID=UPI003AAB0EF2